MANQKIPNSQKKKPRHIGLTDAEVRFIKQMDKEGQTKRLYRGIAQLLKIAGYAAKPK